MIINLNNIASHPNEKFDEEVDLSSFITKDSLILKGVSNCHVKGEYSYFDPLVILEVSIKAKARLICSRTLEEFDYPLTIKEKYTFTLIEDPMYQDEDIIKIGGDHIDTNDYVYELILSSIPQNPIKPGAKLPQSGKGYRVLSEDELKKEREKKGNSAFDKLLDLDLDD